MELDGRVVAVPVQRVLLAWKVSVQYLASLGGKACSRTPRCVGNEPPRVVFCDAVHEVNDKKGDVSERVVAYQSSLSNIEESHHGVVEAFVHEAARLHADDELIRAGHVDAQLPVFWCQFPYRHD